VSYLRQLEAEDRYHRLVVLIPEMQALHAWQRILNNQRGFVLDRAIQQGTENVVICRLRFRPTAWSSPGGVPVTSPDRSAAEPSGPGQRAAADDGG
jgi:hypothetical protein